MENTFFGTKHNRFFGSAALVLIIVALGAYAYYTMQQARFMYSGPTTISVTGEGEVVAVPDIAKFSFSVTEKGADAKATQSAAATKVNALVEALKAAGIEEKDIKTEYYNLYPVYKYEEAICPMGVYYCPGGEQVEDGYEVSQTLSVKVRDLNKSGELLSLVGSNGATNISSLEFTIDDATTLKDEARAEAIADARAKAEVLAKDLGVRLDKMVGYYENERYPTPYYGGMGGDMMAKEAMVSVAPSVPVGENTTTSQVTITYQVK